MTTDTRPIFFIHVMKTGGTTLQRMLRGSFADDAIYPNATDDDNRYFAHIFLDSLRAIPEERRRRTQLYVGHFPFLATEVLDLPLRTFTLLRDPVDRVISHVKQNVGKHGWRNWSKTLANVENPSLEAVYEDELLKPMLFLNHQVRMFSMTAADNPKTFLDITEVDESRLELACRNLEKVDCLGVLEQFDEFVAELTRQFGLPAAPKRRLNVTPDKRPASQELRERIAHDNRLDTQFYNYAKELCRKRYAQNTR